jgi:glutamate-5-semialdehyde dehydrogenase
MDTDLESAMKKRGGAARKAAEVLAYTEPSKKSAALADMAALIEKNSDEIQEENRKDIEAGKQAGLTDALLDRLTLTDKRIAGMASGIRDVIDLPDPVGKVLSTVTRPSGITIEKVSVPIGAIGIIYESRPNVTADAASLCIKAGNSVLLKGGKEAIHSNCVIGKFLRQAVSNAGLPEDSVQVVSTTKREAVQHMLRLDQDLNLIIPRGGEGLIRYVAENSTIPVIKHYKGVCAIYVDKEYDSDMAVKLIVNAKAQRPGVCNSIENLFIHRDISKELAEKLNPAFKEHSIQPVCDKTSINLFEGASEAVEEDWYTEYLDLRLTIGLVDSADEAVAKITEYGSGHSDAIITSNKQTAEDFLRKVDSSAVYHNTSTRFTDGGEFGLGAEIGISTDKLHARGPMGLEELTSYKYIVRSDGAVRT